MELAIAITAHAERRTNKGQKMTDLHQGTHFSRDFSQYDGMNMTIPKPSSLKVKKLDREAVLPCLATEGDVGYDCVALDDGTWAEDGTFREYKTGLAIEVPLGFHTELFARSSVSKYDLILANGVGVVDNGFRGELKFRFKYIPRFQVEDGVLQQLPPIFYKKGDKIGQIVIRWSTIFPVNEVQELSDTKRGSGGFGSTDKR